jgi:hypothetical protein
MSKAPLLTLLTLLATPALALEKGTYPVSSGELSGEIEVTKGWLNFLMTGPDSDPELCQVMGFGPILRGTNGDWAAIFETEGGPCVMIGDRASFSHVGESCAQLTFGDCEMSGVFTEVNPEAARPIQVIKSILGERFDRLSREDRRSVQAFLLKGGLYEGKIDGSYGPGTEAALIAHMQGMADRGEPVDGNSTTFIRELIADMAVQGRALTPAPVEAPAQTATPAQAGSAAPIYVGSWSCGGQTYAFTAERYRMINEYDGSVLKEGRLRPDEVDGRTAYLELVGFGNLTFFDVGTPDMVVHDPSNGETWDCVPR